MLTKEDNSLKQWMPQIITIELKQRQSLLDVLIKH